MSIKLVKKLTIKFIEKTYVKFFVLRIMHVKQLCVCAKLYVFCDAFCYLKFYYVANLNSIIKLSINDVQKLKQIQKYIKIY